MERLKIIHRFIAGGNIVAACNGFMAGGTSDVVPADVLLLILIFCLRLKIWYDDEQYLIDVEKGISPDGAGFDATIMISGVACGVWYFASFFLKHIEISAALIVIAFVLSTLATAVSMIDHRRKDVPYAEQKFWLVSNVFYMLMFAFISVRGRFHPLLVTNTESVTIFLISMTLVGFLVDLIVTRHAERARLAATPPVA